MDIKVILCNCKGLCVSFDSTDMNTLPFEIESELDVNYSLLSPQLCGMGGNQAMHDLMTTSTKDT